MKEQKQIDIWIDLLTSIIVNTRSGDVLPTEIVEVTNQDLKLVTKSRNWRFNWKIEQLRSNTKIFKLVVVNKSDIIQGLISLEFKSGYIFVNLVENAPFNIGQEKLYEGVPGNLFAFACKLSWDNGNKGFVSFISKAKLIEHYNKTLGAVNVFGQRMVIGPVEALKLINQYFPEIK